MKTLLIYDNSGKIWNYISGNYTIPDGLPYIETEIPAGYSAESVNPKTRQPVLKKLPETDAERIANLESAVLALMDMGAM